MSISSGMFPDSLKVARVVPIFKKGDKTNQSNYRPISILPTYSKIIEKVIYKQVYNYLTKYSILNNAQYGFRSGKSTTGAILRLLSFIYPSLDRGDSVISVFLDFSKAFDSVNHQILLKNLNKE